MVLFSSLVTLKIHLMFLLGFLHLGSSSLTFVFHLLCFPIKHFFLLCFQSNFALFFISPSGFLNNISRVFQSSVTLFSSVSVNFSFIFEHLHFFLEFFFLKKGPFVNFFFLSLWSVICPNSSCVSLGNSSCYVCSSLAYYLHFLEICCLSAQFSCGYSPTLNGAIICWYRRECCGQGPQYFEYELGESKSLTWVCYFTYFLSKAVISRVFLVSIIQ